MLYSERGERAHWVYDPLYARPPSHRVQRAVAKPQGKRLRQLFRNHVFFIPDKDEEADAKEPAFDDEDVPAVVAQYYDGCPGIKLYDNGEMGYAAADR